MTWGAALALMLGTTIGLMLLRLPVAFAFFGANIVGAWIFLGGERGLVHLSRSFVDSIGTFQLAPVALFILMGELLFRTGVAFRAIDAIDRLIARVPGRLAVVSVAGGTVFSALSGSTLANTAMLGKTLLPEMRRRNYAKSISLGPILGTGGIAMLIPPSGLAVLLGSLSGISIVGILLAGAIPGIIMALTHTGYVIARCTIQPSLAPAYDLPEMSAWERWGPFVIYVVPLLSLFAVVVGSILVGFATPSESAALGAVGALALAACYRSLSWERVVTALRETGELTVMILFIIGASLTFSQILSFSGATSGLLSTVTGAELSPLWLVVAMLAIMLFLGCIMDPVSIMLICLPFFMPLAEQAGLPLIWFGVCMLLALEIGQTTPPFGVLLFVMKGVAPPDVSMRDIYVAVAPFIVLEVALLAGLVTWPGLVEWLPAMMAR